MPKKLRISDDVSSRIVGAYGHGARVLLQIAGQFRYRFDGCGINDATDQFGKRLATFESRSAAIGTAEIVSHGKFLAAAPDMFAALFDCYAAETARLRNLKAGSPASTYTAARIEKIERAICKATGLEG